MESQKVSVAVFTQSSPEEQPFTCQQCKKKLRLFGKGFKYLIKPSWQLAVSQLFLAAIPFTTFFFLANVGFKTLIGSGLGISMCNIAGISVSYAIALAVEEVALKKESFKDAVATIQKGLLFCMVVVCLPVFALWMNASNLLLKLKQNEDVINLAEEYTFTFIPGLLLFIMAIFMQRYIYIVKQTSILPILLCSLVVCLANVGLNALFVLSLKLGIRGGALSTVLSYVILCILLFLCILWRERSQPIWPVNGIIDDVIKLLPFLLILGWHWDSLLGWGELLTDIFHYIVIVIAEWWTFDISIFVLGAISLRDTSSQIILCFIIELLSIVVHQFASESADQVKDALSEKFNRRAAFILKCSMLIIWLFSIGCGTLLVGLKYFIPLPFTDYKDFSLWTEELIILVSPIPFLRGTQALGFNILRKTGYCYIPIGIVLAGYWIISLPVGLCLLYLKNWGVRGLWTGYALGLLIQRCCLIYCVAMATMISVTKQESES